MLTTNHSRFSFLFPGEGGEGEEPPPDFHPGEDEGDHSGDQEEDEEDEDGGSSAPSPLSLVPHPGPDYNHLR